MTDLTLDVPTTAPPDGQAADVIRNALQESRQRWRHLVTLAADIAYETDAQGRFVLILPDGALGWPSGALIGQPSEILLGDDGAGGGFNPFSPGQEAHRRRCWVRRCDGSMAMMAFSVAPIRDAEGVARGARGVGVDLKDLEAQPASIAGRLRHGEVLDHVLSRVGQEADADRMMDVALWSVIGALQAEGAAVLATMTENGPVEVIHECGPGASAIQEEAARLVAPGGHDARHGSNPDGRPLLTIGCPSRFSAVSGLAVWRHPQARTWTQEDVILATSATGVVRMILDYEAMHQRMAEQARTDPLTGLFNRRAFMEEMGRHLVRMDRDPVPGTLMYLDIDSFKAVNDRLGHAAGDSVLMCLADMLRRLVRPSDLIARLGGDEFAVWLNGADHMTAAERADHLCAAAPGAFRNTLNQEFPGLGLSVGIAARPAGGVDSISELMKRADFAMYEVKRGGRGHWRVAVPTGDA